MTGLRPDAIEQDQLHIDPCQFEICSAVDDRAATSAPVADVGDADPFG